MQKLPSDASIVWLTQVERLSKLIETPVDEMEVTKRLQIINSTVNVDKRLVKLFELIETDILAKIVHSSQTIAPYKVSILRQIPLLCFSVCVHTSPSSRVSWPSLVVRNMVALPYTHCAGHHRFSGMRPLTPFLELACNLHRKLLTSH